MRTEHTPSNTAALVAALRRWGKWLPATLAQLAPDTHGAALAGGAYAWLDSRLEAWPSLARLLARRSTLGRGAASMALRTRVLDDAVKAFVQAGGRQVVILGAGLDARAWRLADALRGCAVFEVDSPGSQRVKLAALARAQLEPTPAMRFIAHDFEHDPSPEALPAKLRDAGLDTSAPVLTVWEAVTMYLSRDAVAAALAAVRAYSAAPGSRLAVTYLQTPKVRPLRARITPWLSPAAWLFKLLAWRAGEHFKSSFEPGEARGWLAARGAALLWDKGYEDIEADLQLPADGEAHALLAHVTSAVSGTSKGHRFALADVSAGA